MFLFVVQFPTVLNDSINTSVNYNGYPLFYWYCKSYYTQKTKIRMAEGMYELWIFSSQPHIVMLQKNDQFWVLCCQIIEKFVHESFM
jgi:hypothetical protein